MKKVVVIGGGTGSFTVLNGLKRYPIELTAVVTVADSGGSTGRLRDEFGFLPVGDFRMALVALADEKSSDFLRKLFLYRFSKGGDGLKGHNFGNLFLVAVADLYGSYQKALDEVSRVLNIKGRVLPITDQTLTLNAQYENGEIIVGETNIDEPDKNHDGKLRIDKLWVEPEVSISKETMGVILDSDFIVLGPGDLYTSTLANIVVPGTVNAINKSKAKIIYIINLMTKYGQTYGFTAKDHVEEIRKYIGKYPDYVLINNKEIPENIIKRYEKQNEFLVVNDLKENVNYNVILKDLLSDLEYKNPKGDVLRRSLIRHDSDKLAWQIVKITNDA